MSGEYSNLYYPGIRVEDFVSYCNSFRAKYTPITSKESMEESKSKLVRLSGAKGITVDADENALHLKLLSTIEYMYGALISVPQLTKTYENDEKRFDAITKELSSIVDKVKQTPQSYVNPLTSPTFAAWETARTNFEWNQSTFTRYFYEFAQAVRSIVVSAIPAFSYYNSLLKSSERVRDDIISQRDKINGFKLLCSKMKNCDLGPALNTKLKLYNPILETLDSIDKEIGTFQTLSYTDMPNKYYELEKRIQRIQVVQFDEESPEWAELNKEFQSIRDDKETLRLNFRKIKNNSTEYITLTRVYKQFKKQYSTFKDFKEMKTMVVDLPDTDETESSSNEPSQPPSSVLSDIMGWLSTKPIKLKRVEFDPDEVMKDFDKFNAEFIKIEDFLKESLTPSNVADVSKQIGNFTIELKSITKKLVENYPKYEKIETVLKELVRNNQSIVNLRNTVEGEYNEIMKQLDSPTMDRLKTDLNDLRSIENHTSHVHAGERLVEAQNRLKTEVTNLHSELNKYESEKTLESKLNTLQAQLRAAEETFQSSVDILRTEGYRLEHYDKKIYRKLSLKLHPDKQDVLPANERLSETKSKTLFAALGEWHESWEKIQKIKKDLEIVADQIKFAKNIKDIQISSDEGLERYKQQIQRIRDQLNQKLAEITIFESDVDKWNKEFTSIKTQMEAKAEELYVVLSNNKESIQSEFRTLRSKLEQLEPRVIDIKTRIESQVPDSSAIRNKLDRLTKMQLEMQEFKTQMDKFDFELPQRGWWGNFDVSAKQMDERLKSVNERSQKLIQKIKTSIREVWVDVLESEDIINNNASTPLVERMWESVTGERYAKRMGQIFEKSQGLAGKSYSVARTEIQKRNAIIAASTVGLTAVLYYLYWKGKHYWKKHKLLKRLDEAKPRLMWIVVQPYSRETLTPVDVVPTKSQTYPYDAVMDLIRTSLNPSNDLVLKRIKKAKGLEYGFQTYMTLELLPEIQAFLVEELKRNNLTSSKLIDQIPPQTNRVYLPVWAE